MTGIDLQAKPVAERDLRGPAVAALVLMLAVSAGTAATWPERGITRRLIEDGGLLMIYLSIWGQAWSVVYLGDGRAGGLATTGPYSISRNPYIFFTLVGIAGMGAQSGSLTLAALFLVAALTVFVPVIRREEAELAAITPRLFRAYRRITPRLLPRLGTWRSPPTITMPHRLVVHAFAEGLPLLLAWPLLDLISLLQQAEVLPVLVRWP